MFDKEKIWEQPCKNIFPTPLKMHTKYDTLLLIYVFKTNLSKKKKKVSYSQSTCDEASTNIRSSKLEHKPYWINCALSFMIWFTTVFYLKIRIQGRKSWSKPSRI